MSKYLILGMTYLPVNNLNIMETFQFQPIRIEFQFIKGVAQLFPKRKEFVVPQL